MSFCMARWSLFCVCTLLLGLYSFADVSHNVEQETAYKTSPGPFPFQDPSLPWDKRVDDLVERLTLDELVNQTISLYGTPTYGIPRLGVNSYVWIAECLRGLRGTNSTSFPQAIGLAATFNKDILHDVAEAISYEVRAHWNTATRKGVNFPSTGLSCFSPFINIIRHPLWGRIQETYGEDPYLTGMLTKAYVMGLQGQHPRYVRASSGCKVVDVHSGPDNIPVSRFSFDAKVSMRDWRMTYMPAFKMCIDAGTYNLMCSYNSINGIPACANSELLTTMVREEMGFRGYVISDDGALENIYKEHHYTKDAVTTAAASITAGCNLELGTTVFANIPKAIDEGLLKQDLVRQRVRPLMYTRMRLGEFDPPSMNPYNLINMSVVESTAHQKLAILAAMKSFVLLKNEPFKSTQDMTLPLKRHYVKVAIVGPMSDNVAQLYGGYSSNVNPALTKTPWQALKVLADNAVHSNGCSDTVCSSYNSSDVIDTVKGSDLVVVCLGTGVAVEDEGKDRSNLDLPGHQFDLLKDAAATGAQAGATVIILLFNAGPLDVTWAKLSPNVHAMLECFFPAQATGLALLQTLQGLSADAVPAGRLPVTWPAYLSQVPPITDYNMNGRTYRYYEGDPLYPFGYGLSYTTFKYSNLHVNPQRLGSGGNVTVNVSITNSGQYTGDEVVQVYLQWLSANQAAPKLQLVSFQRMQIQTQQTLSVNVTITAEQMAVWVDDTSGFKVVPGMMTVYAGGQQPHQRTVAPSNVLQTYFTIE